MSDLVADLLSMWIVIPCLMVLTMRRCSGYRVTMWIGFDTPIGVEWSRERTYWCPLGLVALEIEAEGL